MHHIASSPVRAPGRASKSPASDLVSFYNGSSGDYKGRLLSDILSWPDEELEYSHDYIQTLFPLPEESRVNWNAPLIDRQVFEAFRSQDALRQKLGDSFRRILAFYGFEPAVGEGRAFKVVKAANFPTASRNWLHRFDHNHLRITRIIRSLRILGLEDEARAFYDALLLVCGGEEVSKKSLLYWERAVTRPLNIAPEVDDELVPDNEAIGKAFLREFEQSRKSSS